eukprot:CFRG0751T1
MTGVNTTPRVKLLVENLREARRNELRQSFADDFAQQVTDRFPGGITFAFAYGSGISPQTGSDVKDNMIDLVFAVKDSQSWHRRNIERNPSDYSFLRFLGPPGVTWIQKNFGASIYYNTLVSFNGRMIKYGVIEEDDLSFDLQHWNTLYLSGRLHKPITILKKPTNEITTHYNENIMSALRVALLLLPDRFTEAQLYETITAFSYMGDFRMTYGEHPRKIQNIVQGNLKGFQDLYKASIQEFVSKGWLTVGETISNSGSKDLDERWLFQSKDVETKQELSSKVPTNLRILMGSVDMEGKIYEPATLQKGMATIVKRSSLSQSVKGLLTAGLLKSTEYLGAKLKKYTKAKNERI